MVKNQVMAFVSRKVATYIKVTISMANLMAKELLNMLMEINTPVHLLMGLRPVKVFMNSKTEPSTKEHTSKEKLMVTGSKRGQAVKNTRVNGKMVLKMVLLFTLTIKVKHARAFGRKEST